MKEQNSSESGMALGPGITGKEHKLILRSLYMSDLKNYFTKDDDLKIRDHWLNKMIYNQTCY